MKEDNRLPIRSPLHCLAMEKDRLLIPSEQIQLVKTMLFHLEWQREVARAFEQQIAGRLPAGSQAFAAERIDSLGVGR
jgi:hypothetical protein